MPKIIVVGDTHFQDTSPFYQAQKEFIDWFSSQPFNSKENIFLSLGDLFDRFNPSPKVNSMVLDFFENKMNFQKKYVISGNYKHEYNTLKKNWAIDLLESLEGVKLIKYLEVEKIGNLECLVLPWYYKTTHPEQLSIKEYYENLPEEISNKKYDFIFGHITDVDLFGELVDISYLQGKKVLGHVHSTNFGKSFLGTPYILSKNEKGDEKKIMSIDVETGEFEYITVPKFIDYYEVNYPDEPVIPEDCSFPIFEVFNAPSIEIAKEKYKDIIIKKNGIHKVISDKDAEGGEVQAGKKLTIKQFFENFCKENKVNSQVKEKIGGLL